MTTERERFEAWWSTKRCDLSLGLPNNSFNDAWAAWQAALAQPAQDVVGGLVVRNCEFVGEPPPPFKNWVELLHAMLNNKTLNGVRLQATAASRNAAPQPAPAAWTPEQIDAIHKDADEIGSKARTPRLADAPAAERSTDGGLHGDCSANGEPLYHPPSTLSDADIITIRDECLPSQGEAFDCVAFARAILIRAGRATVAEDAARKELREISAALNGHRDNLTMTTAQCVAELREDAARYRWLRSAEPSKPIACTTTGSAMRTYLNTVELDRAIDAARGKP